MVYKFKVKFKNTIINILIKAENYGAFSDEMNGSPVHHSPPPLPGGHPTLGRDPTASAWGGAGASNTTDYRRGSEPGFPQGFNTTPNPRPKPCKYIQQCSRQFQIFLKTK